MLDRNRASNLHESLGNVMRRLRETAYLMVGLPDYRRYVAHIQAHHPETAPMTEVQFVRERTDRRYGGKGVGRCC